jgi:hypothetical protein
VCNWVSNPEGRPCLGFVRLAGLLDRPRPWFPLLEPLKSLDCSPIFVATSAGSSEEDKCQT